MKTRIFSTLIAFALLSLSAVQAQTNLGGALEPGRCSGIDVIPKVENLESDDAVFGESEPSKERIAQELICEEFDDNKAGCLKQEKCQWHGKPKLCDGKPILGKAKEEDEDFCRLILEEDKCIEQDQRCIWGYRKKSCNPQNPENEADAKFCEAMDIDEAQCERHDDRCDWD